MAQKIKKMSKKCIAFICMITLVFSYSVVSVDKSKASGLTGVSDVLDDSRISPATAKHTISFTTSTAAAAAETIKISFPDNFTIPGFVDADITFSGATLVAACGGGGDEVTMTNSNTGGDKHVTFTVCAGDTVTAGAKVITLGTGATKITNPTEVTGGGTADIYTISIGGSMTDSGDAMVAIIKGISVSATVDESLSFAIAGVASAGTVNGATTNITTTVDTVPFGTVVSGTNKIGAHDLTVSTNASGGYTITTEYTAALTNDTSDTITDEVGTNAAPDAIDAGEVFGYTTDDSTLQNVAVDRFISDKWAKFTTSPLEVAYSATAVSAETTRTGYQMGISATTPAGIYTTTVIYICTPTY